MCPEPFPHIVLDQALPRGLLTRALAEWPPAHWPGWVSYQAEGHRKKASDFRTPLPAACGDAICKLAALPVPAWLGLPDDTVPDLSLWGSGLHEISPGGRVGPHLDADTQPRLHLARRATALVYLHTRWEEDWGGELRFLGGSPVQVAPLPGRLVAFAATEIAFHEVTEVRCPPGHVRLALAMFWYGPGLTPTCRPRALFVSPGDCP